MPNPIRSSTLAAALVVAALVFALGKTAAATPNTDFATCPAELGACDDETSNCCYRSFPAASGRRAVVIPMDRCHQSLATGGKLQPPTSDSPAWCVSPSSSADNGMFEAYGLVYRLMQFNIPIYWVVNPTKDPPALTNDESFATQTYLERDIDIWILGSGVDAPPLLGDALASCTGTCSPPVLRLNPTSLLPMTGSYEANALPVRGGAFVIAAEDRQRFDEFWQATGEFSGLADNPNYDFSAVDLYEVQAGASFLYQDFRSTAPAYVGGGGSGSAPVAMTIDYSPPRLARMAPAGVSALWLSAAKLDQPATYPDCLTGAFEPADAVYCDVSESDIRAGYLVDGEFKWAWIDNWSDNSPCGNAAEVEQQAKIIEYVTHQPGVRDAGHVMLMEKAVEIAESCIGMELAGTRDSGAGLVAHNQTPKEPLILRRPHNLLMQWVTRPPSSPAAPTAPGSTMGTVPPATTRATLLTRAPWSVS